MTRAEIQLPVFLPGSKRDWDKVAGVATIQDNGDILIKLRSQENVDRLIHMAQERILLQMSFDYRMDPTALEKINARYKPKDDTETFLEAARKLKDLRIDPQSQAPIERKP